MSSSRSLFSGTSVFLVCLSDGRRFSGLCSIFGSSLGLLDVLLVFSEASHYLSGPGSLSEISVLLMVRSGLFFLF